MSGIVSLLVLRSFSVIHGPFKKNKLTLRLSCIKNVRKTLEMFGSKTGLKLMNLSTRSGLKFRKRKIKLSA